MKYEKKKSDIQVSITAIGWTKMPSIQVEIAGGRKEKAFGENRTTHTESLGDSPSEKLKIKIWDSL